MKVDEIIKAVIGGLNWRLRGDGVETLEATEIYAGTRLTLEMNSQRWRSSQTLKL